MGEKGRKSKTTREEDARVQPPNHKASHRVKVKEERKEKARRQKDNVRQKNKTRIQRKMGRVDADAVNFPKKQDAEVPNGSIWFAVTTASCLIGREDPSDRLSNPP
ncbi:hypothetical protein STEG23_002629 [Scotinomys teguina]